MPPPRGSPAAGRYVTVLLISATVACERPVDPIAPNARTSSSATSFALPGTKDVPGLAFDVPLSNRPWDMSDSALSIGLQKSGGRAFIALKTPAAPRISETIRDEVVTQGREPVSRGTRSAVSKADLAEGLKAIAALGVTVRQFFDAFAVVDAQVEVSGLAALRADPHVEFIEPVVNDFQLTELPASAATRSAQPLQQP